ncbi:hypothetical protein TNCV_3883221 [Trichonephila clavipes]|nr:hypothetical protein TNCV_3883221 [Trichonephila clavipes]
MENTTFAMPSIIDSHDMGLRTVYSPDAQKKTPIQRLSEYIREQPLSSQRSQKTLKLSTQMKNISHAYRIPSLDQSPTYHSAE